MTLPALPFAASFMHPLMMWGLLAAGGYSMFLGIKAKKVRTGTPEQRKALLPGKFAQRHYRWGSLILGVLVTGMIGGMAVTYINNGVVRGPASARGLGDDWNDCLGCIIGSVHAARQCDRS